MYFNGMFCLDIWNNDADYAIFDDFEDWTKLYNYKQFLGAQKEFTVSDKYRKKQIVRWGKPCIVLANSVPDFKDQEWIKMNCVLFIAKNKFY